MSPLRRRILRPGTASVAVVATILMANAPSVGADSPTYAGWWTSANPGVSNSSVPTFVPSGGGPGGSPSDVPADGLEVSSLPGDDSVAAIGYFSQGTAVTKVVLHQASNSATVPGSQVEACSLTGSGFFTPAYGAPASQEPKYSCDKHTAGVVDASAGTVSFAVAGYVHDSYLGIAIVAVGTSRMVFDAPGKDTIVVAQSGAAPAGAQPGGSSAPAGNSGRVQASPSSGAVTSGSTGPGPAPAGPAPAGLSSRAGSAAAAQPTGVSPSAATAPSGPGAAAQGQSVAVTEPISSIGTGSAVVGFLLILAGALLVSRRNRRLIASSQ